MRILLVGGTKGLGEAIKSKLDFVGPPTKVLCMSRSSSYPNCDLRWEDRIIKQAVRDGITVLGGLDTLLVSSGMGAYKGPLASDAEIKDMFQVNVFGPMSVFKACQKELLKNQGKAIFVSSTCSRRPGSGGLSVYGSTKAALNSWVMSEARRQAKHEIGMCTISPGWFDSPMTDELNPKVREAAEKSIPFGRFGEVDEIAKFIISLINQSNWCLAGSNFEVSGGA